VPKIHVTDLDGSEADIDGRVGYTLMEELKSYNYTAIEAACGGSCSCATCHVIIDGEWFGKLTPPTDMELELVSMAPASEAHSRLSCQVLLSDEMDGLKVRIAQPGAA